MTRAGGICVGLLAVVLACAVFNEGGRSFIPWNLCILTIGLVSLVCWPQLGGGTAPGESWLWWALVLPSAYVAAQLVPLPIFVLKLVSSARAELVAIAGTVAPVPAFAPLSINPNVTLTYLLNVIAYTLTFFLIRGAGRSAGADGLWVLVLPLVIIAGAEAAFGLSQAAAGDAARGTYRNRDHYAGLLEMALPMTVACALSLLPGRARGIGASVRPVSAVRMLIAAIVLAVACVILAGLLASMSKMGFIAALAGLLAMGTVAAVTLLRGATRWMAVAGLIVLCLVGFVALPGDEFINGFGRLFAGIDPLGEGRWPIWQDASRLLKAYPLFGSGFGTFATAFLKYQTALVDVDFTFAHNDYLQLAIELGLAGFVVFIGLMAAVCGRAVRAASGGGDWNTRVLGFGCVGAIAAIAVHGLADFNMYIPANPLVLAWIGGIAVALPVRAARGFTTRRAGFQAFAAVLAGGLVIYAGGRVLLETRAHGNREAARLFCRIGICDTTAVAAALGQATNPDPAATIADVTEAARQDPAAPYRWCDLGEALAKAGREDEARGAFNNALALGPNIPTVQFRAASFLDDVHERPRALALTADVVERSGLLDSAVFNWYRLRKVPAAVVVGSLQPAGAVRASRAYIRYLMDTGAADDAAVTWQWMLGRQYVDAPLARDYVNALQRSGQIESAARSWAAYAGDRAKGFLDSTFVFNGGFESDPTGAAFDWIIEGLGDNVKAALDTGVARTGSRSLRLRFGGKDNVDYHSTWTMAFVPPGVYRFQAFVRTEHVTTNQGIGFRVYSDDGEKPLELATDRIAGTHDWTRLEQIVRVTPETRLLVIQIIRKPSLKFDNLISGTVWIDDVSLEPIR